MIEDGKDLGGMLSHYFLAIKSQRSLDSKSDLICLVDLLILPDRSKNPRCRLSPSISCLFHHEASAKIRIALFEFATGISALSLPLIGRKYQQHGVEARESVVSGARKEQKEQ
ncbi:hypothetical protein ACEPAH_2724 [Sanghuangporus vaninii]